MININGNLLMLYIDILKYASNSIYALIKCDRNIICAFFNRCANFFLQVLNLKYTGHCGG